MLQRAGRYLYNTYYESLSGLSREVWIISILMLITRSGLMVVPFLSIYLITELNFTIGQAGTVVMCFGLGSICSSLLGGLLTDRFGYKRVMLFSLLTGGLSFWSLLLAKTYIVFCVLVFVTSLLADLLRPAVMSSISRYSTEENRTRAISLLRMAINFGIAVGPAVGGILVLYYNYDILFILNGGMMIVSFIIFFFVSKTMKEQKSDKSSSVEVLDQSYSSAYNDYDYWYLLFILLLIDVAFLQIIFAVPLFFKQVYLLSEAQVGLFFTINGLMIFFFEMPIVNYFEKKRLFYKPIILGGIFMTIGFFGLLIPAGKDLTMWLLPFIIYTAMIGFGEILNLPFFNSLSLARGNKSNNGSYMGLFALVFSLSFATMGKIGSFIIDKWGFDALWLFCAALCIVSTLLFHSARDRFLISDKYN